MKHSYIVTATFLLLIGGISAGSMVAKDREFSPNENRYLSSVPKPTVKGIMSGEFQDNLEKYLNDQILGRDQWITLKTAIQKKTGDTDIGGAYVGKNGYDFEKIIPENIDEKLVNRNIKSVNAFFQKAEEILFQQDIAKSHLSFMLVPTSGLVMEQNLPKNAILFDQEEYIDRVQQEIGEDIFVDVRPILKAHAGEYVYYMTDHHWTTYGAYLAKQEWNAQLQGRQKEQTKADESKMPNFIEVADDFRGSLYSKILDYDSAYDSIYRLPPASANVQVLAEGKDIGSFYQTDKLEEKDKYAYFFGGNYGEVAITNLRKGVTTAEKNAEEIAISEAITDQSATGNLLVIKDSFANTFVPLIADQYEHIYMIDLRYFKGNMQEYMEEKQITDVLVLYNISNFVTDKNLYKLGNYS